MISNQSEESCFHNPIALCLGAGRECEGEPQESGKNLASLGLSPLS